MPESPSDSSVDGEVNAAASLYKDSLAYFTTLSQSDVIRFWPEGTETLQEGVGEAISLGGRFSRWQASSYFETLTRSEELGLKTARCTR